MLMTEEFNKILEQITDPGDAAVVLIAGTTGFLIDAGFNFIGFLEPGYVGVTFATGALGIKKAIEAGFSKNKTQKKTDKQKDELLARAKELKVLLEKNKNKYHGLIDILARETALFQKKIILSEDFQNSLHDVISQYREISSSDNPPFSLQQQPD